MLFPLITFTYASRCLGVEAIGQYSYCSSIVDYFVLLAGLGIETYAIREAAGLRDNSVRFNDFTTEITSINFISMLFSYIIFLIICFIILPDKYRAISIIISLKIFFTTIGRNWICTVYEDFLYQTVRSIILQLLAIIFLFYTVKNSSSLPYYAFYCIFGTVLGGLCNFVYNKKYCSFKINFKINLKHIKPILYIFATSISAIIYTSSDTTILGIFCSDYNVGLYAVSVKIYTIIRTVIAAVMIVSVPRFSYYIAKKLKENFNKLFSKTLNMLLFIGIPSVIGIIMLSKEIIYIVAGIEYLKSSTSLIILSFAILINIISYVVAYGVMIPLKREKFYMIITIISAVLNIVLNLIFVPIYMENAAAVTTLISEIAVLALCCFSVRNDIDVPRIKYNIVKSIIGGLFIIVICESIKKFIKFGFIETILAVICSFVCYIVVEITLKNEVLFDVFNTIFSKNKNDIKL